MARSCHMLGKGGTVSAGHENIFNGIEIKGMETKWKIGKKTRDVIIFERRNYEKI